MLAVLCAAAGVGCAALLWPARTPPPQKEASRPAPPPPVTTHPRGITPRTAALLQSVHAAGSPSQQLAAALRLSQLDNPKEIRRLLEHSGQFPAHTASDLAVRVLLKRWLEFEPEAALEYCRLHEGKQLAKLLGTWAATHPEEAEAHSLKLADNEARSEAWVAVCEAIAARSPEKAWAMLERLPSNGYPSTSLLRLLLGNDPAAAIPRLEELPPRFLHPARREIVRQLAGQDPQAAWAWARSEPGNDELATMVLNDCLVKDPAQALAMLVSLPAKGRQNAMRRLYPTDPRLLPHVATTAQALQNETTLTADEKHDIAQRFFSMWTWRDPEGAQALLPLMKDGSDPERLKGYLKTWSHRDPAAAEAWVSGLPPGPLRDAAETVWQAQTEKAANPPDKTSPQSLVAEAAEEYIEKNNPRIAKMEASHLAEWMKSAEANDYAGQDSLLRGLATANPSTATEWLGTVEMDAKTGPMAAQFSAAWAFEDPAAAAAWVKALPAGPLAQTAAENVARNYQLYAPDEARAWAESLPTGPAKTAALAAFPKQP